MELDSGPDDCHRTGSRDGDAFQKDAAYAQRTIDLFDGQMVSDVKKQLSCDSRPGPGLVEKDGKCR